MVLHILDCGWHGLHVENPLCLADQIHRIGIRIDDVGSSLSLLSILDTNSG